MAFDTISLVVLCHAPFRTRVHWLEPLYMCTIICSDTLHYTFDNYTQLKYYNKHVLKIT